MRLFGVRFDYKVESADSGGSLAVLEVEIPAKTLVKPHNHTREDEFSLILAGTVGVRVGDRVLQADAGASLVKPRGTPHAMWNADSTPARVVEILSPGGLERYFQELPPILAHEGTAPAPRSTTSWRSGTASPSRTTGSRSWSAPTASSSDRRRARYSPWGRSASASARSSARSGRSSAQARKMARRPG